MDMQFKFGLTDKETELVFEALGEMPFKKVVDLFFKLRQQVQETDTPNEAGNE